MDASKIAPLNRRGFLKQIGSVAAASGIATGQPKAVSIIVEPDDVIATSAPSCTHPHPGLLPLREKEALAYSAPSHSAPK